MIPENMEGIIPLLQVSGLMVGYDKKAIAGPFDFNIQKRDYLCIVGENGSGKSTLMKTLLGLQTEISGSLIIPDSGIGYLPQQTDIQKGFPATVWEVILSGRAGKKKLFPFYGKEDKEIAQKNMERMGMEKLQTHCYGKLSGGQQQRVLLARALCATEQILLLDEPVAGLDPQVTKQMYDLIASLNKEGITIIEITHDVKTALTYANKVLWFKDHKQAYFGRADQFSFREENQL